MPSLPPPVLLGADLNCYSMARAFFALTGKPVYAYGKMPLGATQASSYVHFHAIGQLEREEVLLACLEQHAKQHPSAIPPFLLPCTDAYAAALIHAKSALSSSYLVPMPPPTALSLFDKQAFYDACRIHGIPYPQTHVFSAMPRMDEIEDVGKALGFPFIIKPASSLVYWQYPFSGMEKVYLAHNRHEAHCVLLSIFSSGYPGTVLCQRYIAGGDTAGQVLTLYMDRHGKCRMQACAQVLLEEHTPCGKGNYAAMVTAPLPTLVGDLCRLLKSYSYHGFANFDLRYDRRDGRLYVLELNLRPGRSNYFLTGAGLNPAAVLLHDYFDRAAPSDRPTRHLLFRTVPFSVVWRYTASEEYAQLARRLHRAGQEVCPLDAPADLWQNPRRAAYVLWHRQREKQKFKRYCPRYR